MKIFQNLVKLIVLSIFVLPVLLYGVSGTLTEKVPSKTVKLHDSLVKGSSKSVPGEFRSLEAIVMDQVTDSYGGGTGTLWIRGGLMISGIQIINEVGSFEGFVGGTAQKKATGKGKGEPKKWNFNLTGTYNINKCTNNFNSTTNITTFDPTDKPYKCLETSTRDKIIYIPKSCSVDTSKTWSDVNSALNGLYGEFNPNGGPRPQEPKMIDSQQECGTCKTSNFLQETYLLDWDFPNTSLTVYVWAEVNSAGPLTRARWAVVLKDTIEHELKHRDIEYKPIVLDPIKPTKFVINVCNNNNSQEFANRNQTISRYKTDMKTNALSIRNVIIKAWNNTNLVDGGPTELMTGNTSLTN